MKEQAPRITAVIVNYRSAQLAIGCLESLNDERQREPGLRAMVVDNASDDGSAAAIAAAISESGWHDWVELMISPVNGGFAHGNNQAIDRLIADCAPDDLVWLLNPDTIVQPGASTVLANFMAAHPEAGIAGSLLIEADGAPWPYAFRFPSLLGELERGARLGALSRWLSRYNILEKMGEQPSRAQWVSGASMVVRGAVFADIGMMDDGYFLYFEETDFCLQAARAGWGCWYVPDAHVVHIAGQSTGLTGQAPTQKAMPGYWFESRRRYFIKNHGRSYAIAADLFWTIGHMLRLARHRFRLPSDREPRERLTDFLSHSALFNRAERKTA